VASRIFKKICQNRSGQITRKSWLTCSKNMKIIKNTKKHQRFGHFIRPAKTFHPAAKTVCEDNGKIIYTRQICWCGKM